MPIVSHRGAELSYADVGAGPALVFQHGYLSTGAIWQEILGPLSSSYRCIVVDGRGTGSSSQPAAGYGVDETVDDLIAVADHARLDRFTYVGHSLGGTLGYLAAQRVPDRVERLVLVCPGPAGPPRAGRSVFAPFHAAWRTGDAVELSRLLAMPYAIAPPADVLVERGLAAAKVSAGHVEDLLNSAEPFDIRDRLPEIAAPVLVVTADRDGPFRAVLGDYLLLADASLHVFSGVGHVPQQECPEQLVEVVERFVSG